MHFDIVAGIVVCILAEDNRLGALRWVLAAVVRLVALAAGHVAIGLLEGKTCCLCR